MNIVNAVRLHEVLKAAIKNRKMSREFDYGNNCQCVAHVCAALSRGDAPLLGKDKAYGDKVDIANFLGVDHRNDRCANELVVRLFGFDVDWRDLGTVEDHGPAMRHLKGIRGLREAIVRLKTLVAHCGDGFKLE